MASSSLSASGMHLTNPRATADVTRRQTHTPMFCASKRHQHLKPITAPNRHVGIAHPSFGTVKVGMPTRHWLVLAPLDRATVGARNLQVCYDRKQAKDAPSSDTDVELPAAGEEAIFRHYGLTYEPGAGGERRLACR
jgi:hypothetical protein